MSRFARRKDTVAPAIVQDLRDRGAMVLQIDVSEPGAPDLAVLFLGSTTWLEIKSPGGKLNPDQQYWHDEAAKRGVKVCTVKTPAEARRAVGMGEGERYEENLKAMRQLTGKVPVEATSEADIECGGT